MLLATTVLGMFRLQASNINVNQNGIGKYPYTSDERKLIQDYNVKNSKAVVANDHIFIALLDENFDAQQNETNTFLLRMYDKQFKPTKEVVISKSDVAAGGYDIEYNQTKKKIVLVWEEYVSEAKTSKNIYLQAFDLEGNVAQQKMQINQDDLVLFELVVNKHGTPRLAYNESGIAYVSWKGADENNWNSCVYGQKIDANNKKIGQNVRIAECINDTISKSSPDVAFAKGTFFFIWEYSKKIYAQILNEDFVADSELLDNYNATRVDENQDTQRGVSILTDGKTFFIAYEDFRDYESSNGKITGGLQVRMRPFSVTGTPERDSMLLGKLLNLRGYTVAYGQSAIYTTMYGHENSTGSDQAQWQVHLLYTDLKTFETKTSFTKKLSESDTNIRSSVALDQKDLYLTWKQDRSGAPATPGVNENVTDLVMKNYSATQTDTPSTCTENDWTASEFTPATCPDTGIQSRTWTKKNECESGVTHPDKEQKMCFFETKLANTNLYNSLRGKIILRVEKDGEAYYINPAKQTLHYLGRASDAFRIMREQGIGITNKDIAKIPISLSNLAGEDQDKDGLTDEFEDAIGTNENTKDTDKDGFADKTELQNNYSPIASGEVKLPIDMGYASKNRGKIFLQVEKNGEAWYTHVLDSKRYFLGRPNDAFFIMRNLGIGISEKNFSKLLGK
ncbi:MAG: hypothetical protein A3E60_00085 [Candidatus Kerfeldbacteria bacterium RIFCSPHIGHO2_12_FULL_42_13]|nr:MAG: hypothetical protein A3E60_00085 [Candidatus Kerfeldbacteria bacterium RIFCSPHIGHO2_12_FULL_42_13]